MTAKPQGALSVNIEMAAPQTIRAQRHFDKGKLKNHFGDEHQTGGQGDKVKIGRFQFKPEALSDRQSTSAPHGN